MVKQISAFLKRPELSDAAFRDHWRHRHADVVRRLPGIRQYVQNHVTVKLASGTPSPLGTAFDGVAEVWFDDMAAMRGNANSLPLADIRADEANFIAAGSMASIITDEHLVVDGEPSDSSRKLVGLVKRRPELSADGFQDKWLTELGPLVAGIPNVCRYVQAHCRPGIYRTEREPAFDGMASLWFDGDALPAEAMQPIIRLEATFMDTARTVAMFVDPIRIV